VKGRMATESGPVFSTDGLRHGDRVWVQIVASDGEDQGATLKSKEIVIANSAPVIVSQPEGAGEDGVFRYRVRAEDPDNDSGLQYTLVAAPEGMTISSGYGAIEWKPGPDQSGTHIIEVSVQDREGAQSAQRFEVVVDTGSESTDEETPPASTPLDG